MVRIYCLTCISKIPPRNIPTIPYRNDADETTFIFGDINETPNMIKLFFEDAKYYQLTEICIGFEIIGNLKRFVMKIFREDTKLYVIPMHRGAVTFSKISDKVHELYVATSKLFSWKIDFDLLFKIRCIKNTIHKGFMTKDEKELYEKYAKHMKFGICLVEHLPIDEFFDFQENQFDSHPLEIPNTTRPNALRTKLSLFNRIIDALCHPENGSYKNVPSSQEFNQKAVCLLKKQNVWLANKPRKGVLETNAKNFQESEHLVWDDVDISKLSINDFKPKNLKNLELKETRIFDSEHQLLLFFQQMNLKNLQQLKLFSCKISILYGNFFTIFSPFLSTLSLRNNDIIYISPLISELYGLTELDLSGNKNLSDKGFFFEDLPTFISSLFLEETSLTKIPKEIKRLENLSELSIKSEQLKFMAWQDISTKIEKLCIIGGDGEMNEVILSDKNNLKHFELCHTTLKALKCSNLPPSLTDLNLSDNKLTYFDMENKLPLIDELHLHNNNLIQILWETLSPNLQYIGINYNKLQSIGNISHLIYLEQISATHNQIKSLYFGDFNQFQWLNEIFLSNNLLEALPEGFENLKELKILDLSKNKFNYSDETNLEEVLWKRLPKKLKTLNLSHNSLHLLPCMLKDYDIENCIFIDCKISYICPYLYAAKNSEHFRHFEISKNPLISLPFIAQTIIEPPLTKVEHISTTSLKDNFKITSDNMELILPLFISPQQCLESFLYEFLPYKGEKVPFKCYCCSNCGCQTNENSVEQIMIMDCLIEITNVPLMKSKTPKSNKKNYKKRSKPNQKNNFSAEDSNNSNLAASEEEEKDENINFNPIKHSQQFLPGKWKTRVITRLCKSCLDNIQNKAKEIFKLYENKYLLNIKTKKQLKSLKNFFVAVIEAIDAMENLKDSIKEFSKINSCDKNDTNKITSFNLQESLNSKISNILDLRHALPWLYQHQKDEVVLSELFSSIDSESQKLLQFSYETLEICYCQQWRNALQNDSCFTLALTVNDEFNGTFESLLSNWSQHYTPQLCDTCKYYIYANNYPKFGTFQKYFIIEINVTEKMNGLIFHKNFTSFLIFGTLWMLVGAIELQDSSEPRNYITWKKNENKWKLCKNGRKWFKNEFPQNLKNFPILIFEKLSTVFIAPNNSVAEMPSTKNFDNSVISYVEDGSAVAVAYQDQHLQSNNYQLNTPELSVFQGHENMGDNQLYPQIMQPTSSQFHLHYSQPVFQGGLHHEVMQQQQQQQQQDSIPDHNNIQQSSDSRPNDQQSLPPIYTFIEGKTFQNL